MDSKNNLNESLGFLIKEKRKLKGFTQSELAKLCGISTRHVGKLENGTYIPRLSTYLKLSTILELNIENMSEAASLVEVVHGVRVTPSLAFCGSDPMHLLPVPDLFAKMYLFIAQVHQVVGVS